ncbi:hypothetical protein ACMDB5_12475 [Flavobacterium sp. W1B]|uniref:hypothetical protein n=1 Tax=Flavobacterium sp. W1B TaxID=3394146 RepID=UPI0039BCADCC
MHHTGPFSIPAVNYFPEKIKPWIIILFVIIFQFSGGVYLATASEMVGSTDLMQEDVLMAGYASLAGMALTFTFMLRLKMRITTKVAFLICSIALIICNVIALYTTNIFVLVATCFVAGIFKMWATFECNSTIQLWITPTRDMPIFFCYIYLLVQSVILLGGVGDFYIVLFSSWHYIHWFVIGTLLFLALFTMLFFNNRRLFPAFPLFGIDWLGAFLWGLILMTVNFIFVYGEHYDWWYSEHIQIATVFLLILLGLNIYRASFIRHPFISLQTFKYKAVYQSVLLYLVVDLFISPSHLIEHIYFEAVLGYDMENLMYVSWIGWLGVLAGAFFAYRYFALKQHSFKSTFLIGFSGILVYLLMMYFFIDKNTSKELLAIPLFFRNFGYVIIAIVLISDLVKVPFHHFFQAISVQAFISAACGSAIAGAALLRGMNYLFTKNFQLISANIDRVNYNLFKPENAHLEQMIPQQVLLVSFKEMYGYLVLFGILFMVILILYKYPYFPKNLIYPRLKTIKKVLKLEMS